MTTYTRPAELRACLRASIEGPTPDPDGKDWKTAEPPNRWTVTLHHKRDDNATGGGFPFRFDYWTGPGIEPTTVTRAQALASVLLDCGGIADDTTFEDWADEYGYDTDSRRAEATFQAVHAQRTQLLALLAIPGDELDALIGETDPDADPDHEYLAGWLIGTNA